MDRAPRAKRIIMWALTYKCNADCEYCYLKNYMQPFRDIKKQQYFELAQKIVACQEWQPQAVWLTGGEPTILPFLPDLISYFEEHNISTVLNTNALVSNEQMKEILLAGPTGIIVSFDSNSQLMISGRNIPASEIVEKLEFISRNKNKKTLLGVATVLTNETINGLFDHASRMENIGVDYLSLNPMHNWKTDDIRQLSVDLENQIQMIKSNLRIKIPSDLYLSLIKKHYNKEHPDLQCPSLRDYFFISPWGYIYPCSDEGWQKYNGFEFDLLGSHNWYREVNAQRPINWEKRTSSSCFSDRCIGCFKLYFDSIFTGELEYGE